MAAVAMTAVAIFVIKDITAIYAIPAIAAAIVGTGLAPGTNIFGQSPFITGGTQPARTRGSGVTRGTRRYGYGWSVIRHLSVSLSKIAFSIVRYWLSSIRYEDKTRIGVLHDPPPSLQAGKRP